MGFSSLSNYYVVAISCEYVKVYKKCNFCLFRIEKMQNNKLRFSCDKTYFQYCLCPMLKTCKILSKLPDVVHFFTWKAQTHTGLLFLLCNGYTCICHYKFSCLLRDWKGLFYSIWQVSGNEGEYPWFRVASHPTLSLPFSSLIYNIHNKKQLCWESY